MAIIKILWVLSLFAYQAFIADARREKSLVPALYVFGDSTIDAGNNNNLNTIAKANVFPYGIDFHNKSTGRFSNGKTFADMIAIKLGLPMPPPYLGVGEYVRHKIATGINYGSASCGILNDSRDGDCLSLDKQIEYFTSTVKNDLLRNLESKDDLSHYLSKSIYLISAGSNDYRVHALKVQQNPEEYADYLLEQLASRIQRLYNLGARKFVIASMDPIGCLPVNIIPHSQDCNEFINKLVEPFSDKLPRKLQKLQAKLSGSLFVTMDRFNYFKVIRKNPKKFGFTNVSDMCIKQGEKICEKRKEYIFFDFAHYTEAANKIYAEECFGGRKVCFPMNIKQLVQED